MITAAAAVAIPQMAFSSPPAVANCASCTAPVKATGQPVQPLSQQATKQITNGINLASFLASRKAPALGVPAIDSLIKNITPNWAPGQQLPGALNVADYKPASFKMDVLGSDLAVSMMNIGALTSPFLL